MTKRISIRDVAASAGVSVTTVSHVLNATPGTRVKPETPAPKIPPAPPSATAPLRIPIVISPAAARAAPPEIGASR